MQIFFMQKNIHTHICITVISYIDSYKLAEWLWRHETSSYNHAVLFH